ARISGPNLATPRSCYTAARKAEPLNQASSAMDDFPIEPPLVVKDTPKPRRLATLAQARAYVDEALRLGRPAPWRELWHRLKSVTTEDEAIEAIGDMRELLAEEDLLVPPGRPRDAEA